MTFVRDSDSGLSDRLRANISRFAAYKAVHVERALKEVLNDLETPLKEREKMAKAVIRFFERMGDAEYNTAVARARTAKQFEQFLTPERKELFPNLRWLPSRSADPRTAHRAFYDKVWAKDDPFWSQNSPGTEWNCKCDVEETDDPATDNSEVNDLRQPSPGLEGNPALTGEIFTDNASYIRSAGGNNSKKRFIVKHQIGDKLLRKDSYRSLQAIKDSSVLIDKQGEQIEVVCDARTRDHLSNDVARTTNYLWNEKNRNIQQVLRSSKLVAHEPNTKLDKKPWAVEYFYYEYKTTNDTFYLSVEYNDNKIEKRQFYRLYALSKEIRETAVWY